MRKIVKPMFLSSSVVLASGLSMAAGAQGLNLNDVDIYAGASVGQSTVETDVTGPGGLSASFDENDTGWKAYAGGNYGLFGVEGGYVDFGSPSAAGVSVDVTGWDLFAVLNLPVGPVDAFAKAGYLWWDADASANGFSGSTDGSDPAYGVGVSYNVADNFNVRAEYERFDVSDFDTLDLLSAGVEYRF